MKNSKVLIAFGVLFLIILILLGGFFYNRYFCYTAISSTDNSFKISVPNRVKFKVKESSGENYFLDFYCVKDEMFFYSNVINKQSEINLKEVVNNEKNNVSLNLQNVNMVSDILEFTINNYKACKYSYTYTDTSYGNDLFAEVVWIETDSKIYVLDLEVITKNMEKYKGIFEKIENSFNENI